jgi:hypothetical protein
MWPENTFVKIDHALNFSSTNTTTAFTEPGENIIHQPQH